MKTKVLVMVRARFLRTQQRAKSQCTVLNAQTSSAGRFVVSRAGLATMAMIASGADFRIGAEALYVGNPRVFLRLFIGINGEFDPGSGRTLAACLTHASRAERPFGVLERRTGE
jgi:hypothetical protein